MRTAHEHQILKREKAHTKTKGKTIQTPAGTAALVRMVTDVCFLLEIRS